jgi:hypothetical protein
MNVRSKVYTPYPSAPDALLIVEFSLTESERIV